MKIVDTFLVWWLRTGRYWWSRVRRRLFEQRYLRVNLPKADSPGEIQACLEQVTWTMDGPLHLFDSISYPQVTWSKKKDDCDGFSTLAAALLKRLDSACNPVLATAMVRPVRKSHTVCVFRSSGAGFWFFDNHILRSEDYQTYGDVIARITRDAKRLVCWDVRDPDTLKMLEFHRV